VDCHRQDPSTCADRAYGAALGITSAVELVGELIAGIVGSGGSGIVSQPTSCTLRIERAFSIPLPTWAEVAPTLPPELLDHAVAEWLAHGSIGTPRYEIEAASWPTTERPITDVLATRALLRASFNRQRDPAAAQQAIDAALAADKTNVLARMVQWQVTHAVPPDEAGATAVAHPDDWRAWWLLGYTSQHGPEAIEAHDKLCALAAGDPLVDVPPAFCGHRAPP